MSHPSLHWLKPALCVCCVTVCLCISTQTLKYLSKTPCSRQSPEIVKEFLTTMMPHKLTKSVTSHKCKDKHIHTALYNIYSFIFPHQGRKTAAIEPPTTDSSGNSACECHQLLLLHVTIPLKCHLIKYPSLHCHFWAFCRAIRIKVRHHKTHHVIVQQKSPKVTINGSAKKYCLYKMINTHHSTSVWHVLSLRWTQQFTVCHCYIHILLMQIRITAPALIHRGK